MVRVITSGEHTFPLLAFGHSVSLRKGDKGEQIGKTLKKEEKWRWRQRKKGGEPEISVFQFLFKERELSSNSLHVVLEGEQSVISVAEYLGLFLPKQRN